MRNFFQQDNPFLDALLPGCGFAFISEEFSHAPLSDELEQLIDAESTNVKATLPLVERDSCLGWEPSMDYRCDADRLRRKLRQLDNLKNQTLRILCKKQPKNQPLTVEDV